VLRLLGGDQTKARRLLRVLFLWRRALPADPRSAGERASNARLLLSAVSKTERKCVGQKIKRRKWWKRVISGFVRLRSLGARLPEGGGSARPRRSSIY
jgi:hypothetical protein